MEVKFIYVRLWKLRKKHYGILLDTAYIRSFFSSLEYCSATIILDRRRRRGGDAHPLVCLRSPQPGPLASYACARRYRTYTDKFNMAGVECLRARRRVLSVEKRQQIGQFCFMK